MKVVHIINADTRGGAPKAAYSLHKALLSSGIDSRMLVQRKFSNDDKVSSYNSSFVQTQLTNSRMLLDIIQMKLFSKEERGRFSFASIGKDISDNPIIKEADIFHLHWINEGYLSLKSLQQLAKLGKPVVWTLHDMWAFTGGCHYSSGCKKYEDVCCNCPYLKNPSSKDFSTRLQQKKSEVYNELKPHFITCSNWLAKTAKASSLLKDYNAAAIPNPIDVDVYKPLDKKAVRKKLGLSENKKYILFGTLNVNEERKGFKKLVEALNILFTRQENLKADTELLIYGTASGDETKTLPAKVNSFGRITDTQHLVECYNAADVFVAPSLEDNLPNTVMESLACGIPVVTFNIGGMPDMIEHNLNGYLAEPFSTDDFAEGIKLLLNDEQNQKKLSAQAREKVLGNYQPFIVAARYQSIYNKLLSSQINF
ncbi:MAG: glycosyltransferase [Ignavibacteriales bacterium]|nr:MAG: glycosyltransferase [Ignavibacteriales bacterium]